MVNNNKNKCRPILVQGLRRDIQINFNIIDIYGFVAQFLLRGNEPNGEGQQQQQLK